MKERLVNITWIAIAIATRTASADDPPQPAQPTDALDASGSRHYELAEYDQAIADFKEAFRISDTPRFLFNIAQAYRLKSECEPALTFYKTYVRRAPDAENVPKVRERIAEMGACL